MICENGKWIVCGVDWDDPECIHTVTALYKEDPKVSWERIVEHMHELYPIATDKQIRKELK